MKYFLGYFPDNEPDWVAPEVNEIYRRGGDKMTPLANTPRFPSQCRDW
jgi:hypothetical protein